ncbi:MAG: FixH family protein [Bacteroidetes Order II. Incertae sedis bacterium]|nr:FixH family protein [Bacteroidetes Order II. bacterium]
MPAPNEKGYYRWPIFIIALLAITMIGSISVLFIANYDGGAKVVDNYYKKALDFDKSSALIHESEKLGWQVTLLPIQNTAAQVSTLVFMITDRDGNPLQNLSGKLKAERVGTTIKAETSLITDLQPGKMSSKLKLMPKGLWDFTLLLSNGQQEFKQVIRQEIL